MTFTIEFSNVGQPAQVTAPTDAKPITELQQQIQGLLGRRRPAAAAQAARTLRRLGRRSAVGSGGADSEAYEKYAACLEDAKGDQDKVAKCFDLLR